MALHGEVSDDLQQVFWMTSRIAPVSS